MQYIFFSFNFFCYKLFSFFPLSFWIKLHVLRALYLLRIVSFCSVEMEDERYLFHCTYDPYVIGISDKIIYLYIIYIYIYICTLITKKVQKKDENRKNGSVSKVKPLNLKGCLVLLFIDAHVGVMVPQCLSYFFSEHLISCQTLNNANYTVYI